MHFKKKLSIFICLYLICAQFYVYADDYSNNEFNFTNNLEMLTSNSFSNIPNINSRHSVVIDRYSKKVLYGKKENEKCKMASTTKIMTSIIILENCPNLDEIAIISKNAASTGGSRLGLVENDKVSIKNLLYGLMLVSGNDAAVALAEFIAGNTDNFASLMNKKALDLGLESTNFTSPHGLDNENHYTTAFELALLTDYALKNNTFRKIVGTKNYTITINNNSKNINNTNELLGYLDRNIWSKNRLY